MADDGWVDTDMPEPPPLSRPAEPPIVVAPDRVADTSRPDACANCGGSNLREVEWSGEWLCDDCDLISPTERRSR